MSRRAAITGWGCYSPAKVLSNSDLEKLVDTSDEWIVTRTGIRERHIAGPGETTSSMCTLASQRALESARLAAHDLDLIVCATTTPDYLVPVTGCLIQQRLGADRAGAFDVNTACSGFLYALSVAAQFIQAGTYERILVVTGETLTRFTDWHDRNTCVLFGDGASAVVLEASGDDAGVLHTVLGSRGDVEQILSIDAGGSARPASTDTLAARSHFIRMRGNDVFKMAVRSMGQAARDVLARTGLTLDDIRMVIPHQANLRIINALREAMEVPEEKVFINVDRHGNTGAASVAIALGEYLATHTVTPGDNFLLVSFGGGLSWAASIIRWADVASMIRNRRTQ